MDEQKQRLREVLKGFSKGIIAYYKVYAEITESVTAGLLLSQIAFWWFGPAGEKPFFKTAQEFMSELVMGSGELRAAKARLESLGLIKIEYHGMPKKTYYEFNESAVLEQISNNAKIAQLSVNHAKTAQLYALKSHNNTCENRMSKITDNTTERTRDNKKPIFSENRLSEKEVQERVYGLLIRHGVSGKVAKSIIYEQHIPLESIKETIKNGLAKQKSELGFILKPGYIIATLNGARDEGKIVGPTMASKKLSGEIKKIADSKAIPRIKLTPDEFNKRKNEILDQLKQPVNSEKMLATA